MRILMLTPELPEASGIGGARRCWELIEGLRARGHEVAVGSVGRPDQAAAVERLAAEGVRTAVAVRPEPQWREALLGGLRSPRTVGVLAFGSFHRWQASVFAHEMRGPVRELLAAWTPDVVLLEHDWAMRELARLLPDGVPAVVDFHNITARMHASSAATEPTRRGRWMQQREARLQDRDIDRVPACVIAAAACSQTEVSELAERTKLPVALVPNGANVARLASIPLAGGDGGLLFSGSLGYPPNAVAATWLATEVLPRVHRRRPGTTLTITGPGAPPAVAALASEHVRLPGFVPALEPVLASASVYVAGLRSGAGTKLKVVEALAAGRPLVATSVAADGVGIEDGTHALIADDPGAFADAVVRVLDDPALATRLAQAGREHVAAHLSWDHSVQALERLLAEQLDARGGDRTGTDR